MGTKIGRYKVLEKLTKDSVFLAENSAGDKKIIKQHELTSSLILSPLELKTLMNLQHINILPPSDVFTKGKFRYVVYEYSDANNLQNYIKDKGKLTEEEILTISKQIIDAYEFLQENRLIHGNIKPTNILINEDSRFKFISIKETNPITQGNLKYI